MVRFRRALLLVLLGMPMPAIAAPVPIEAPYTDAAVATAEFERVVRAFLAASSIGIPAEYEATVVPHPEAALLISGPMPDEDMQASIREQAAVADIRPVPGLAMLHGAAQRSLASLPVGTRLGFSTSFRGQWLVGPVVKTDAGWRVDTRYWVEMRRMAAEGEPAMDDPRIVARRFLWAAMAGNLDEVNAVSARPVQGTDVGIPNGLPGGDLDQVLSLAVEMPVVRARAGEVFVLPSGRRVTGTADGDEAVFVGQYGPVELPFLLLRIDGAWKVEPEDYFSALRALGAI
jgi:hypothetical protein